MIAALLPFLILAAYVYIAQDVAKTVYKKNEKNWRK